MPRATKASASPPAKKASAAKAAAKKPAAKKAASGSARKTSSTTKTAAKAAKETKAVPAKKPPVKKAPAKAPVPTSPYDQKFLDAQHQMLLNERRRLTHDVETLVAEADELAMMREPGDVQFDEESGEGDTLAVERERDLALSAQFRSQIEDIDHALTKIEDGSYGVCEVSGQPIPKERLKAIPWARERVEYKVGGFGRR